MSGLFCLLNLESASYVPMSLSNYWLQHFMFQRLFFSGQVTRSPWTLSALPLQWQWGELPTGSTFFICEYCQTRRGLGHVSFIWTQAASGVGVECICRSGWVGSQCSQRGEMHLLIGGWVRLDCTCDTCLMWHMSHVTHVTHVSCDTCHMWHMWVTSRLTLEVFPELAQCTVRPT